MDSHSGRVRVNKTNLLEKHLALHRHNFILLLANNGLELAEQVLQSLQLLFVAARFLGMADEQVFLTIRKKGNNYDNKARKKMLMLTKAIIVSR
jgi:hypothetical protein